jgi:ubiquinone/menaquinone biosynthesis C-methylase UbiE
MAGAVVAPPPQLHVPDAASRLARDADRLARQAHVMASATAAFLARVGVQPDWRCLDVGCGDGQVTLALARAVGPDGRAIGIDIDEAALAIARETADRADLPAQFVRADATAPVEHEAFDLVYSRLLLSHLAEPVAVLRAMRSATRPDGWVAVEDLFTGTLRAEPPAPALDALQASTAPPCEPTAAIRRPAHASATSTRAS